MVAQAVKKNAGDDDARECKKMNHSMIISIMTEQRSRPSLFACQQISQHPPVRHQGIVTIVEFLINIGNV